jgi:CheY-like chemotaxis protein
MDILSILTAPALWAGLVFGGIIGGAAVYFGLASRRKTPPATAPPLPTAAVGSPRLRHELRTLVSSVVGMADMLVDAPPGADTQRWSDLLRQSSQHLLDLVQCPEGFGVGPRPAPSSAPVKTTQKPQSTPVGKEPKAGDAAAEQLRKRVLVVEDNAVNQLVVLGYLKHYPVEVTAVFNGQEAIEQLARGCFHLVLMDCSMPVMDGYEATRRIRASEVGLAVHLPIVAVTANASLEDEAQCRAVGMDDYVAKPLQRETTFRVLDQWLH